MVEMEQVERVYSHYAGVYDMFFDRILDPGRQAAVDLLRIEPSDRVLEIGIGTGLSLRYFPPCASITGIDISTAMLAEAQERVDELRLSNVDLIRMDATRLDFPDDHFDRILLPYVLSVVDDPDRVLDEIVRVARPGARIGILNHFGSRFRWLRVFETVLTPLTRRIGFRLDLPVTTVAARPELSVRTSQRVNPMRLWQLLVCDNCKDLAVPSP
jgi:phosphatidylethanolamine/phosphatidyl-N-methylethanolamine N-methyltransferase